MKITNAILLCREHWDVECYSHINQGECREFAEHVSKYVKGSVVRDDTDLGATDYWHSFIEFGGKFYDSETPYGVEDYRLLPIYSRL